MKYILIVLFVAFVSTEAYPDRNTTMVRGKTAAATNSASTNTMNTVGNISLAQHLTNLVTKMNELQRISGGDDLPIPKMLGYLGGILDRVKDEHSLSVAGDNGTLTHGGIIGDLIGAVLGSVGVILGGKNGMCGGSYGLYMKQHGGILGQLFDLVGPLLGPLASDEPGTTLLSGLLDKFGLNYLIPVKKSL